MIKLGIFLLVFLFVGCSHSSISNRKEDIQKRLKKITVQLENIQAKEDLKLREKKIKIEVDLLAKIVISMKKDNFLSKEVDYLILEMQKETGFEKEFQRVMKIDGCKEIYQNLSLDALYLLDAFERKLQFPFEKSLRLRKIEEN